VHGLRLRVIPEIAGSLVAAVANERTEPIARTHTAERYAATSPMTLRLAFRARGPRERYASALRPQAAAA
jgi:hypothetical protein